MSHASSRRLRNYFDIACKLKFSIDANRLVYFPGFLGAIHSTKLSGNFGPKLNGSVRSNRKSFEKTGPPFGVVLFSRSDRLEFWLNGSRPLSPLKFATGRFPPGGGGGGGGTPV